MRYILSKVENIPLRLCSHARTLTHKHMHTHRHGDMLYLAEKTSDGGGGGGGWGSAAVEEDEVDRVLGSKDGKIKRQRDTQL